MKRIFSARAAGGKTIYFETDAVARPSLAGSIMTGSQLRRDGSRVDNSIVVLSPADLAAAKELEMDLHYGWLVPIGTAKISVRGS